MNNSKRSQCQLALLILLIVSVSFGYVGGCAKGKDDSREESPPSSGSAKEGEKLKVELQKRMEMHRDQHKAIDIQELIETYGYQVVPAAETYLWDSELRVRLAATMLIRRAGLMSTDKVERQKVVGKLLDYGLKNPGREDGILKDLLSFQAVDYSEAAKEVLQKELSTSPEYTTILLVGAADVKSALPALKAIVNEVNEPLKPFDIDSKASHSHAFAALMARARMGVKEDVKRCIEMVEAHPDEEYRVIVLLKRLSYVRQPEVVEYLKKYLFMDNLEPGPENLSRMTYAQRAAMALAQMLRGFPGNPEYGGNQETIEQCRKWMAKQKKWNIIR
jgi:hypothetical protein